MAEKIPAAAKRNAADGSPRPRAISFGGSVDGESRRTIAFAGVMIVFAALAAYSNSFSGALVFDDTTAISQNPTIKHLGDALAPPPAGTTGGRPFLNLTFAVNYALSGLHLWSYHAFNLLVHALAGLVLFGILRRTLHRPALRRRFGATALPLALVATVIWVMHPLQTESVTYLSERAEELMGLFYLLTLYCFLRGTEDPEAGDKAPGRRFPAGGLWLLVSVFSCLLGALSKEIIVTAPVLVLLYDRTFISGSWREPWRRRWIYYVALATTWLVLARLMSGLHERGAGFNAGVRGWQYALTSCRSLALYLKLSLWPHPLVLDYGPDLVGRGL